MLRANIHVSAAAAKGYYTEGLSRQDYYSEGQEITGRWGGKGAVRLGLAGQVEQAAFASLCENLRPITGEPLTPRSRVNRRVGYDFNFHCPKSVSVLQALTGDVAIVDAFRAAVNETMCELEQGMNTRIRRGGARADRSTGNITWGEFIHFTGRPVGGVPDPHLHAHCFVFNATFDPVEKRWKAGEFAGIKGDLEYHEAAFHARLATRLQELGYAVERCGKNWEIAGVSQSVIEKFSRRTAQIEAIAAKRGITDAKGKDQLGAKCREKKQKEVKFSALLKQWEERLSPSELQNLRALGGNGPATVAAIPGAARRAVEYAIAHCFARKSVVSERKLQALAIRRAIGSANLAAVAHELQNANLLRGVVGGRSVVTTQGVLAEEEKLIAFAVSGRAREKPLGAAKHQIRRDFLSSEQRAAVEHVLQSKDRVIAIRGGAGTGKTTLMKEAIEGIKSGGKRVFTFAPTAKASREVLRGEGFADADTIARLLQDRKLQASIKDQVIWVDEAGLLCVRDLLEVFQIAARENARVILSGDTRQHSAVERGDALRILETTKAVVPAEVNEIRRQGGDYRLAVKAISEGELDRAFGILDGLGAIREVAPDQIAERIAATYIESVARGRAVLVVSPTHREGKQVTGAIRAKLKERKRLGKIEWQVYQQINLNWTDAEKSDPMHYQAGDVVQFVQNTASFRRGERIVITGKDSTGAITCSSLAGVPQKTTFRPEHPNRFQIYRQSALSLAAGDKIRVTQGGFTKNRCRLENGAIYSVKSFGEEGIECGNGFKIPWDYGNLSHGYVTTSHAAQGRTVDEVLIAQSSDSLSAASREQFYVSTSRGRERVQIFTDDKTALLEAAGTSRARISAGELFRQEIPKAKLSDKIRKKMSIFDRLFKPKPKEPTMAELDALQRKHDFKPAHEEQKAISARLEKAEAEVAAVKAKAAEDAKAKAGKEGAFARKDQLGSDELDRKKREKEQVEAETSKAKTIKSEKEQAETESLKAKTAKNEQSKEGDKITSQKDQAKIDAEKKIASQTDVLKTDPAKDVSKKLDSTKPLVADKRGSQPAIGQDKALPAQGGGKELPVVDKHGSSTVAPGSANGVTENKSEVVVAKPVDASASAEPKKGSGPFDKLSEKNLSDGMKSTMSDGPKFKPVDSSAGGSWVKMELERRENKTDEDFRVRGKIQSQDVAHDKAMKDQKQHTTELQKRHGSTQIQIASATKTSGVENIGPHTAKIAAERKAAAKAAPPPVIKKGK